MAAPKFNSRDIEGIYRLLVVLNSALQFLIGQLYEISANKALSAKYLKEMEALTEEIRATLNRKAVK